MLQQQITSARDVQLIKATYCLQYFYSNQGRGEGESILATIVSVCIRGRAARSWTTQVVIPYNGLNTTGSDCVPTLMDLIRFSFS